MPEQAGRGVVSKQDDLTENLDEWRLDFEARLDGEDAALKEKSLAQLKEKLSSSTQNWETALADRHLLKFLRYRKFDADAAYGMLQAIHKARVADPENYLPAGKGPRDFAHVYNLGCIEILPHRNPLDGSAIVILRAGDWSPSCGVDIKVAQSAASFMADYVMDDERVQRDGVTLVLDCRNISVTNMLHFFPLKCMASVIHTIQEAYPVNFARTHILHQPLMWKMLFKVATPFIKKENLGRIHFHGENIKKLHEFIPAEILPEDLLGPKPSDFEWLPKLLYERHDDYVARSVMMKPR